MEVADLLLMQAKLRDCQSLSEISHLVVNESTKLLNYDVAVLVGHSTRREILAISGAPLGWLVLARVTGTWLLSGIPLLAVSLVLGAMLNLPAEAMPVALISLLLGTPVLHLVGAIGAALTLNSRLCRPVEKRLHARVRGVDVQVELARDAAPVGVQNRVRPDRSGVGRGRAAGLRGPGPDDLVQLLERLIDLSRGLAEG